MNRSVSTRTERTKEAKATARRRAIGLGLIAVPSSPPRCGSVAGASRHRSAFALPTRPDALHEREPVVAEHRPEPRQDVGLRRPASSASPTRPPFRYDPLHGQVHPVARHERQVDVEVDYIMTIRTGVKWSDGKTMTPEDVKYSFDLAKIATHPQHPLWATPGSRASRCPATPSSSRSPATPDTSSSTSTATTSRSSRSTSSARAQDGLDDRQPRDTRKIIGTGPYMYQSGGGATVDDGRLEEADDWWATQGARPQVGPTYVVDIKNGTNAASLCRTCSRGTSTSSTTSRRSPRSRASSRRSTTAPVPPRREHDVAVPEHDEEAARRHGSSVRRSRPRST